MDAELTGDAVKITGIEYDGGPAVVGYIAVANASDFEDMGDVRLERELAWKADYRRVEESQSGAVGGRRRAERASCREIGGARQLDTGCCALADPASSLVGEHAAVAGGED
jgi:hypothetical protein